MTKTLMPCFSLRKNNEEGLSAGLCLFVSLYLAGLFPFPACGNHLCSLPIATSEHTELEIMLEAYLKEVMRLTLSCLSSSFISQICSLFLSCGKVRELRHNVTTMNFNIRSVEGKFFSSSTGWF